MPRDVPDPTGETVGPEVDVTTRHWLEGHGLEARQLAVHCRRELEREALVVAIPASQVEAWFDSRCADYDAALLSVIAVATEPEAWLVHAAAQAEPAEFDDLAWSRIQADAMAPAGGALGWRLRGELPEEVASAVFAAEASDVLAPLVTGGGFHIYRVWRRRPAELTDAIDARCRRDLFAQRVNSLCHRFRNYRELRRCAGFVDEHFLSDEDCAGLVASMQQGDRLPAGVYREDGDKGVAEDIRRVHTTTVPDNLAAVVASRLDELRPVLASHFETSLERCEGPEYLIYRQGDFFRPHTDDADEKIAQRKVSVVVFLNTQHAWEGDGGHGGGELVVYGLGSGPDKAGRRVGLPGIAGSLVAFPAETVHEVLPVAWGERCAVVGWYR